MSVREFSPYGGRRRQGRPRPAVLLSFVLAGAVCVCAALAYAELSTMMPAAEPDPRQSAVVGTQIIGKFPSSSVDDV